MGLSDVVTRPALPGEICSCGRRAKEVYEIAGRIPSGWCGIPDVLPLELCIDIECPCSDYHDRRWCSPERRAEAGRLWGRR